MQLSDTRRAARNAGALAAASVFSKGMLFLWQFALARWLGEAGYGVYGTVGSLAMIATVIGSFGMGLIVIRDVAQAPEKAGAYLTATLVMQTVLVLVAFLAMNAAALALGYDPAIQLFTALAGVGLILDIFGNMSSDQLLAQERMITTSVIEALHIALRIGLVALALWAGFGLLGLYLVGLVAGAARSGVMWWALARTGVRPVWPMDRDIAWLLFLNSAPLAISAVLALAYQQADKLMSTALLDVENTGHLTAAFVIITGVIELMNGTILVATYPLMSRAHGQGDLFGFIVGKLVLFTLIATLPICLTLSLFAETITIPLFGTAFLPTAGVLQLLIWYALAAMLVNVFAQGMMVQNRQRRLLYIRAGGLGLNLVLNLTLLIGFNLGVMGLVIASVTAETVVLVVMLATFRENGLEMPQLATRMLRPVAAGVLAALVMLTPVPVLVRMSAGLLTYGGAVLLGGVLAEDDWDLLYRLLAAMPGGHFVLRYWHRDVELSW